MFDHPLLQVVQAECCVCHGTFTRNYLRYDDNKFYCVTHYIQLPKVATKIQQERGLGWFCHNPTCNKTPTEKGLSTDGFYFCDCCNEGPFCQNCLHTVTVVNARSRKIGSYMRSGEYPKHQETGFASFCPKCRSENTDYVPEDPHGASNQFSVFYDTTGEFSSRRSKPGTSVRVSQQDLSELSTEGKYIVGCFAALLFTAFVIVTWFTYTLMIR